MPGLDPEALLRASPAGVWVVSDGRTVYANESLVRLLGTSPTELLDTEPISCFDPADRVRAAELLRADAHPTSAESSVLRLRRADGRGVLATIACAAWHGPRRTGVVFAVSPITANMRVVEELRDRERQLREAERLGNVGTWEWMVTTNEFSGSEELYRIYGLMPGVIELSYDEMIARTIPDDRAMFRRHLDELASGTTEASFERRILRPDGEQRTVRTTARVLETDQDGAPVRVLGVSRDVTAEELALEQRVRSRELYERERQVAERLRELDELRSAFIGSVSSDLRAPLATVLGSAATLRDIGTTIDPATTESLLDQTIEQAQHLDGLLSDLVDLERLRRAGSTLDLRSVMIGQLVREAVAEIDNPRVQLDVGSQDAQAQVDPAKVTRVLHNLVRNALRVSPPSSRVRVSVQVGPTSARIAVEDEGPAFPEALRDEMFEATPSGSSAEVPGRASLSLTIVARFVRLHGGTIEVEERAGGGSRIVVELPLTPAAANGEASRLATRADRSGR